MNNSRPSVAAATTSANNSLLQICGRYLVFPLVLGGGLLGVHLSEANGGHGETAFAIGSAIWIFAIALAERWIPFRQDWNRSKADICTDILHTLLSSYLVVRAMKALLIIALLPTAVAASERFGLAFWPHHWHVFLQLALAAVVIEFFGYWLHRLFHEHSWWWRWHAVHHSAERLYWLNAGRDHPLGAAMNTVAHYLPVVLLGVSEECMLLYLTLQSIHGLFQHSNIDVRLGPLNYVFSMSELHRWHHSEIVEEANNNYGSTLIVWDIVFGTRYLPHSRGPANIGIESMPNFPRGYLAQMTVPFRWEFWDNKTKEARE